MYVIEIAHTWGCACHTSGDGTMATEEPYLATVEGEDLDALQARGAVKLSLSHSGGKENLYLAYLPPREIHVFADQESATAAIKAAHIFRSCVVDFGVRERVSDIAKLEASVMPIYDHLKMKRQNVFIVANPITNLLKTKREGYTHE